MLSRLDAGRSALILVAGPPGSGRSHLAKDVGAAAERRDFRVLGCDTAIVIEETTKLTDLRRVLASLLDVDTSDGDDGPAASGTASKAMSVVRHGLTSVIQRLNDERAVFDLIDQAAPAMIAIDGYTPGQAFGLWFTSRLVPHVKGSQRPIVLVVIDRLEPLRDLRDAADDVVELGELARDEVRDHVAAIGATITPPLTSEEIEAYCDAAAHEPDMLTALERVLALLGAP